jgi:hypothetical protein
MEEAPENGKELSHFAHANGMNGRMNVIKKEDMRGKEVIKI